MSENVLHIAKLAAGIREMSELEARVAWARSRARGAGLGDVSFLETRNVPRRDGVENGSVYWIFKGLMQCRQKILRIEELQDAEGRRRCRFLLDPDIVRTSPVPRKAFQGWRYLDPGAAPADAASAEDGMPDMPDDLRQELARIGIL